MDVWLALHTFKSTGKIPTLFNGIFTHPIKEGISGKTKKTCSLAPIAPGLCQCLADKLGFKGVEVNAAVWQVKTVAFLYDLLLILSKLSRQQLRAYGSSAVESNHAFAEIPKFPDIARPFICFEQFHGFTAV